MVQPREVIDFFKSLVETQDMELETAGALANGKRVWALAKTGRDFTINGVNDTLLAYLLLATSYDKQFSTTGQFTSIRVVCQNTLSFSLYLSDHMGEDSPAANPLLKSSSCMIKNPRRLWD